MSENDQFEQHVQRQPLRNIPAGWRNEILAIATAASSRLSARDSQPTAWWRELLWPCPQAWAGLAAVWLVIMGVNFASRDPLPVREARKAAPASRNVLLALKEQEQLLAELIAPPPQPPREVEKTKPSIPQPRSQRREDCLSA